MNPHILSQARTLRNAIRRLEEKFLLQRLPEDSLAAEAAKVLTFPQVSTLRVIHAEESLGLKDLANRLHVSSPSASSMVERLVEAGMIDRAPGKTDRRAVRLSLTDKGQQTVEQLESEFDRAIGELLVKLGPESSDQWVDVLQRITEILDQDERETRSA